jgi:iron complex transport system substrate-binding protein
MKSAFPISQRFLWPFTLFVASLLSACNPLFPQASRLDRSPEPAPSSIQVETSAADPSCQIISHVWGQTQLCKPVEAIVALDPHALDLLLSLDIQPVGYAEDSRALVGSPQAGQSIAGVKYLGNRLTRPPVHVGTWQSPSLETMLRLKPDLILGGYLDQSQYNTFSKIAPTLLPIEQWISSKQWQDNLLTLGKVLDREPKAQQVINTYEQKVTTARTELQSIDARKVLLLSMTGLDYIGIFNHETFAGAILEDLGFELIIPKQLIATNGEIVISLETLPQLEPELIIVMASGNSQVDQVKQVWANNSILRSLPAYQNNQVYFVDYQLWSRIQGGIAAELVIAQVREMLLSKNEV